MLHQYDELSVLLVCLCDHEIKSSPFSPVALIFLFDLSHAILCRIDQLFQTDKHLQAGDSDLKQWHQWLDSQTICEIIKWSEVT